MLITNCLFVLTSAGGEPERARQAFRGAWTPTGPRRRRMARQIFGSGRALQGLRRPSLDSRGGSPAADGSIWAASARAWRGARHEADD